MMIMAAYHRDKGNKKSIVLAPDSAHGTNPASAAIAGYRVVSIPSTDSGDMDLDALKGALTDDVAGIMLTCPSTFGLFDPHIKEICDLIHRVDGLAYYDGANLNAIVGKARPGDFGFDIVHLNLHKTFSTPHGGGGPGAGPVGVKRSLPYLPISIGPARRHVRLNTTARSLSATCALLWQLGIIVRAYAYILMLGRRIGTSPNRRSSMRTTSGRDCGPTTSRRSTASASTSASSRRRTRWQTTVSAPWTSPRP
jgi:glycine dehydrogenase subunit 2